MISDRTKKRESDEEKLKGLAVSSDKIARTDGTNLTQLMCEFRSLKTSGKDMTPKVKSVMKKIVEDENIKPEVKKEGIANLQGAYAAFEKEKAESFFRRKNADKNIKEMQLLAKNCVNTIDGVSNDCHGIQF